MLLNEDERLEDLLIGDYKIIQNVNLYRFSSDSIILSKFAPTTGGRVADFCSGSGIVGLHYYLLHDRKNKVDLFELQSSLSEMSAKTVELNGFGGDVACHNIPVQEIPAEFDGAYSLILCNPPYKKNFSGELNPDDHIAVCRHEIKITLEEIVSVASKKLKPSGRLCICQRTERLTDLLFAMRSGGIEPCRMRFVTAGKDRKPYLVLVEGAKGVRPQLKILPSVEN